MNNENSVQHEAWRTVITRATQDPDFRERLLSDPKTAIADIAGGPLPEDLEIIVVENGPKTFHIVVPSDEIDLDSAQVAGGVGSWWKPVCDCEGPSRQFN